MILRASSLILLVCGVVLPTGVGLIQPGYDMSAQYLSELGAAGAPNAGLIKYAGFMPTGLAVLAILAGLSRRLPGGLAARIGLSLIALTSVSYIGAVFAPCDAGCPAEGSPSQLVHNLLGLVGYLGAFLGLVVVFVSTLRASPAIVSTATAATAVIFAAGFVIMTSPEASDVRGLAQRCADFSLFAWLAFMAFRPGRTGE